VLAHEPYTPGGGRRGRGRVQNAAPDGLKRPQLLGDPDVLLSQLLWTRRTGMCFRVGHFAQRCCGDLHYPALRLNALGMDMACHRRQKALLEVVHAMPIPGAGVAGRPAFRKLPCRTSTAAMSSSLAYCSRVPGARTIVARPPLPAKRLAATSSS